MLLCATTCFGDQKLIENPQFICTEYSLIDQLCRAPEEYDSGQANSSCITQSEQGTRHDEDNKMTRTLLRPGEILQGTNFQLRSKLTDEERHWHPEMVGVKACPSFPKIELTSSDVTRWKMASRLESFKRARPDQRHLFEMIHRRCKDWPKVGAVFDLPVALGFSGAALIYGGLHALAWSAHFESSTEQLLWRMSACMLMGGFPVCYIIITKLRLLSDFQEVFFYIEGIVVLLVCLILLAYILARAYLVVESFINLSHLPAGAYDVPRWSAYFPSIS